MDKYADAIRTLDEVIPPPNNKINNCSDIEARQYTCCDCGYSFWADCDAADYPVYCPYCGFENIQKTNTAWRIL
jgi:DNA-directed RNA polymerase subunit RPC12/RpoP